jgi:hypothetical protein
MKQRKIRRQRRRDQQALVTVEVVPMQRLDDKPVEPFQNAVNAWCNDMRRTKPRCFVCQDYQWIPGDCAPPAAFLFITYPNETFVAGLCYACCAKPYFDARLDAALERNWKAPRREVAWPVEGSKKVQ